MRNDGPQLAYPELSDDELLFPKALSATGPVEPEIIVTAYIPPDFDFGGGSGGIFWFQDSGNPFIYHDQWRDFGNTNTRRTTRQLRRWSLSQTKSAIPAI